MYDSGDEFVSSIEEYISNMYALREKVVPERIAELEEELEGLKNEINK